jgi:hypothetical protein
LPSDFDVFWAAYPRRVGKLAAMKAYQRARMIATSQDILAGVELYKIHMPSDLNFIAHPATFLNQGRWMDEYAIAMPKIEHWADECRTLHGGRCTKRWDHEMLKRDTA